MFMNSQEPALIAIMYGNHAPDASILGFVNGFSCRFASPSARCFASLLPPTAVTHSLHNLLLQVSQESNGLHQAADNFAFDILVEAVAYSQVGKVSNIHCLVVKNHNAPCMLCASFPSEAALAPPPTCTLLSLCAGQV